MIKVGWHWKKGERNLKYYSWAKDGLTMYKNWFNKYMRKHLTINTDIKQSVAAARDCIVRASNSSTWGWDDGS
jgi:hypothetical protein